MLRCLVLLGCLLVLLLRTADHTLCKFGGIIDDHEEGPAIAVILQVSWRAPLNSPNPYVSISINNHKELAGTKHKPSSLTITIRLRQLVNPDASLDWDLAKLKLGAVGGFGDDRQGRLGLLPSPS
ncbi:uncharacterized protein EDB91DRAFT_1080910 [Suillus paluster]|uniref:uncharacterized protein n=1 Tax=Suillus paluster TaxID=48578 RepID=UPI001B876335|nr:uncharacterized protein EDB91DRAFT_1080910 [Suillus paluster]KAG1744107.1 hypothetical protein EDB91DRAFT_1080910 [Suillus paluster]